MKLYKIKNKFYYEFHFNTFSKPELENIFATEYVYYNYNFVSSQYIMTINILL